MEKLGRAVVFAVAVIAILSGLAFALVYNGVGSGFPQVAVFPKKAQSNSVSPATNQNTETTAPSKASRAREPAIIPDVPRDAIPPLNFPKYISADKAAWLKDSDFVIGFASSGDARAYPIRIMNWHEIVNDEIGGKPVLVSYCPLCRSGIVFSRQLGNQVLSFGNTGALYESDLVMYDKQTDSNWFQVGGVALTGPLKGSRLAVLPSMTTTWGEWRQLYPASLVLSLETGYVRNYDRNPYEGYEEVDSEPAFPVSINDRRLLPKEKVLGVEIAGEEKAYSITRLGDNAANDVVSGKRIVVFSIKTTESGAVYEAKVKDRVLTFKFANGSFIDDQTGSVWNLAGQAVSGALAGETLQPVSAVSTFWFAWAASHPDTRIYIP